MRWNVNPPKTDAGDRVITLLEPALEALKAQRTLTSLQTKTEIVFHHRQYGDIEHQSLRFVFMPRCARNRKPTTLYRVSAPDSSAVKRDWHSPPESVPYAAYFCLLAFKAALTRLS
jgi:integrase